MFAVWMVSLAGEVVMEDLSDPCTVWDNVRVCYVTRTELEARKKLYSLFPPTQQPLVSPVRFQWSQSPTRTDSLPPSLPPSLPSALKLNKSPPASSLVQPRSQAAQGQKAFWNKNGSITVMEVFQPNKIKNTKKISWPDPQPEKLHRTRKLSDSFGHNKTKPKIFPPSTQLVERRKKKVKSEDRQDRPALMTRNFTWRGKKVLNLGDTEAPSLQAGDSDLIVPDIERSAEHWAVQPVASQLLYSSYSASKW